MYTIEIIGKLPPDYPFHQYPQTNEHLEGDIRRFSILRDQILDQIASKNSDQGIIKKMLGMGNYHPSLGIPKQLTS